MTNKVEDIAQDLKVRGKLQTLRTMTDDLQKAVDEIKTKKSEQDGAEKAAARIALTLQGVQDEIRKEGVKNGLDPADVKNRVNLVARCVELAKAQAGDARKEKAMLDGEARALQRQLGSVRKMYSAEVASEQRKARIEAEENEERKRRAAKARAAKNEAKKTSSAKKRASKPRKATKSK